MTATDLQRNHPAKWWLIIGSAAGLLVVGLGPKLATAAVLALGLIVIAVQHLRLATLITVAVAPFTNLLGSWLGVGTASVGGALRDVAVGTIIFLWVTTMIRDRRRLDLSSGRFALMGFVALVGFLAAFSEDKLTALYGTRNLALYTGLLFVATDLCRSEADKRVALRTVVLSLSLLSFLAITEVATGGAALTKIGYKPSYGGQGLTQQETVDAFLGNRRATAGVGSAPDYGWLAMFGFLLVVGWRPGARLLLDRWLRRAALGLTGLGLVLSLTRSAWLGTVGGLLGMAVMARDRRALATLLGAGSIAAIAVVMHPEAVYIERLLSRDVSSQTTARQRLEIYQYAGRFAIANPLGVGIGTQGSGNRHLYEREHFTLDSYYLELLGDGGTLLFAAYAIAMVLLLLEIRGLASHEEYESTRGLQSGTLGILSAVLLADATSASMDSRIISIVFWFLIGLALDARPRPRHPGLPEAPDPCPSRAGQIGADA